MGRKQSRTMPPATVSSPHSTATLTPPAQRGTSNRGLANLFRLAKDDEPCPKCENKLRRKAGPGHEANEVPPIVHDVLRSPGRPLDEPTRTDMEQRFGGADFSAVRIHTDDRAAESADAVNAKAFTVGQDVVMGRGQSSMPAPLLAHELAHVEQQAGSGKKTVAPMIQRDFLDDAISTAGDAYDTIAGAAGATHDAVAVGVNDTVSSISKGVSDAVGSVGQAGSEAVAAVSDTANSVAGSLGLDAEKQRANLVGQVRAAEQRAGQISPESELTPEQVGPINAKIAAANVVAPFSIPFLEAAVRAVVAIGMFLAELAAALLSAEVAAVLLVIIIVVAILALLYLLLEYLFKGPMPQAKPKPVTPPKTSEKPEDKPEPGPKPRPRPVPYDPHWHERPCQYPLPITWPAEALPEPPLVRPLVRQSRDQQEWEGIERGTAQRELARQIRQAREDGIPPPSPCSEDDFEPNAVYDAHHIQPMYLGGRMRIGICVPRRLGVTWRDIASWTTNPNTRTTTPNAGFILRSSVNTPTGSSTTSPGRSKDS